MLSGLVVDSEITRFVEEIEKLERGEITPEQFQRYRLENGIYGIRGTTDMQMVRVKLPLGIINSEQMEVLAEFADKFTPKKIGHVTTRQDFQFHEVPRKRVPDVLKLLATAGMTTREACGNTVRNVTACPYAGISANEFFDVTPYAEAAVNFFLRNPLAQNLPRKFKIAFEGCIEDHAKTAIHDLEIKAGQTVAFVGPSGSGKSTLIKLLVGLYKPTAGQILFNSHDGNQIDYEILRQKIGIVAQDTQLFSGTIRENLLFVKPDASDQQCLEVLHLAAADSILERSRQGLDTRIGESGLKLSGGEKQRVGVARAIFKEPELLLLDEATSHLDVESEEKIQESLHEFFQSVTAIVIAHRLTTIKEMDKISGQRLSEGDGIQGIVICLLGMPNNKIYCVVYTCIVSPLYSHSYLL